MNIFTDDFHVIFRDFLDKFRRKRMKPRPVKDVDEICQRLQQTAVFKGVPPDKLREMVAHMEMLKRKAREVVISQGEEGDYYYMLLTGSAAVTRSPSPGAAPQAVAELEAGSFFGEEALISQATRNATVTMKTDGSLIRLPKSAFQNYVQDSLVTWVLPVEAHKKVGSGAKWLDVRDAAAAREGLLRGALNIPLAQLRERVAELDKETLYICYDERGRLSATAAFLLRLRGYNAAVLQGGLRSFRRPGRSRVFRRPG